MVVLHILRRKVKWKKCTFSNKIERFILHRQKTGGKVSCRIQNVEFIFNLSAKRNRFPL